LLVIVDVSENKSLMSLMADEKCNYWEKNRFSKSIAKQGISDGDGEEIGLPFLVAS
jgi:hypothetical protein